MTMQFKVAALIAGAVPSAALAGTAFAHGKPGAHVQKKAECNVSIACGNLNHSLNTGNILSGNVNAPVTVDVSCNAFSGIDSQASTLCLGNFHPVKAGQKAGH